MTDPSVPLDAQKVLERLRDTGERFALFTDTEADCEAIDHAASLIESLMSELEDYKATVRIMEHPDYPEQAAEFQKLIDEGLIPDPKAES